jgi:hypothetical protein
MTLRLLAPCLRTNVVSDGKSQSQFVIRSCCAVTKRGITSFELEGEKKLPARHHRMFYGMFSANGPDHPSVSTEQVMKAMSRPVSKGWNKHLFSTGSVCAISLLIICSSTVGLGQGKDNKGKKKDDVKKVVDRIKGGGSGSSDSRRNKSSSSASDKNKPAVDPEVKDASSPGLGKIVINTDPSEADVTIKNKDGVVKQGRSQDGRFEAELLPGEYDVEVSSAKHSVFEGKATVRPGGKEVVKAHLSQTGWIIIDLGSVTAEVNILIDGKKPVGIKKTAENKIELEDVHPGRHTLRFTHQTIKELEIDVEVLPGAIKYLHPVFEKILARLIVRSEPGADIFIDDKHEGAIAEGGKSQVIFVEPGQRAIRVVKEGFAPAQQIKIIVLGDNEVEVKLTRLPPGIPFTRQRGESASRLH